MIPLWYVIRTASDELAYSSSPSLLIGLLRKLYFISAGKRIMDCKEIERDDSPMLYPKKSSIKTLETADKKHTIEPKNKIFSCCDRRDLFCLCFLKSCYFRKLNTA